MEQITEAEKYIQHKIHKHKPFYFGSMITIIAAIGMILYILYLLYWPVKTIVFNDPIQKVLNEDHKVKNGEELIYEFNFCRYTDLQARVVKNIHDGILYSLPTEYMHRKKGCYKSAVSLTIPKAIVPGEYQIHTSIEFKINPFRTISKEIETEVFTVVKP